MDQRRRAALEQDVEQFDDPADAEDARSRTSSEYYGSFISFEDDRRKGHEWERAVDNWPSPEPRAAA